MRARVVFALLVVLYVCSFFLRGEDPKVDLGDDVEVDFGALFAGLVIVMMPTLICYIFLQEQITKGSPLAR